MSRASLPLRLDRLTGHRSTGDVERTVRELATEYGLDPAEVRAEWEEIQARTRRFGPHSAEQVVRRCAEEFGIPEAELWAEVARVTDKTGTSR